MILTSWLSGRSKTHTRQSKKTDNQPSQANTSQYTQIQFIHWILLSAALMLLFLLLSSWTPKRCHVFLSFNISLCDHMLCEPNNTQDHSINKMCLASAYNTNTNLVHPVGPVLYASYMLTVIVCYNRTKWSCFDIWFGFIQFVCLSFCVLNWIGLDLLLVFIHQKPFSQLKCHLLFTPFAARIETHTHMFTLNTSYGDTYDLIEFLKFIRILIENFESGSELKHFHFYYLNFVIQIVKDSTIPGDWIIFFSVSQFNSMKHAFQMEMPA